MSRECTELAPARPRPAPAVLAVAAALLAACSGIKIKPEAVLPKPLIVPIPADVGLIIPSDTRKYLDQETRFGIDWTVDLGPGEVRLMQALFKDLFHHVDEFNDLPAARAGRGLQAVFEAGVDQYSFVTARETGGRYYAVTIRYRINLYTPKGEKVDSYTLTGYGSYPALGMSGGKPLRQATAAAMRDAAAKFLVQFPEQTVARQLARQEALVADKPATCTEAALIEAVPIDEPLPGEPSSGPGLP